MRMRLNYGLLFALTLVVMPGARSQCIPIVCSLTFSTSVERFGHRARRKREQLRHRSLRNDTGLWRGRRPWV